MLVHIDRRELLEKWLPPLAAMVLFLVLLSLGFWQLDRAAYKKELAASFESGSDYVRVLGEMPVEVFEPIKSSGRFLTDRQFLIDNIVKDGRIGWYVITPFEYSVAEPLLLVNRGWLPKDPGSPALPDIAVGDERRELYGKAGNLPRVGIRPGDAFEGSTTWPKLGLYPNADEIAAQLGREVLSFIMLLDPDPASAMLRRWRPQQSGPATHYGYALQWFAMAAALLGLSFWHLRRRFLHG